MFDFKETLTIQVPDVEEQVAAFRESEYQKKHGLIIEVAAIHEGMTANFNFYPEKALNEALESWVSPYPKPIIMNHDMYSEPVGRVMASKMEKEADGTPYVMLQVAITDPEAITKVMDQRYLTGSVGGAAKQANCSVCGADWAEASMSNIPCKHGRGKTYKGKLCYMEMNGIKFKEYSFVNAPADENSGVRSLKPNEADDGWVKAARVFSLNMSDEEILEFSESADSSNMLESMKKKDASPIYMQLKGAFLSALAISESEQTDEELDVSNKTINEEEEDILAVAEGLSSDLADTSTDEEEVEETSANDDEVTDSVEEADEEKSEEISEETEEEAVTEEEEVEEAEKPEAQESPKEKDIDPENSDGAPVSREEDSDSDEEEITEEEEISDETAQTEQEEEVAEEDDSESDLNEQIATLESRIEELESKEQTLLEENAKLKAAIKRQLAERVVDTKIALGMHDAEEREGALEEHVGRSASSLADSLRDLSKMSRSVTEFSPPKVDDKSGSVNEDDNSVVVGEDDEELEEENQPDPEDVFVDAMMGRMKL